MYKTGNKCIDQPLWYFDKSRIGKVVQLYQQTDFDPSINQIYRYGKSVGEDFLADVPEYRRDEFYKLLEEAS